jgi:hypothetical protein
MWDLWWTKWRWGRFSPSTSVYPANFYTITITITRGRYSRPNSGRSTQSPTAQIKKKQNAKFNDKIIGNFGMLLDSVAFYFISDIVQTSYLGKIW